MSLQFLLFVFPYMTCVLFEIHYVYVKISIKRKLHISLIKQCLSLHFVYLYHMFVHLYLADIKNR